MAKVPLNLRRPPPPFHHLTNPLTRANVTPLGKRSGDARGAPPPSTLPGILGPAPPLPQHPSSSLPRSPRFLKPGPRPTVGVWLQVRSKKTYFRRADGKAFHPGSSAPPQKYIPSNSDRTWPRSFAEIIKSPHSSMEHLASSVPRGAAPPFASEGRVSPYSPLFKRTTCFNYGELGHLKLRCRNLVRCFRCYHFGHSIQSCKERKVVPTPFTYTAPDPPPPSDRSFQPLQPPPSARPSHPMQPCPSMAPSSSRGLKLKAFLSLMLNLLKSCHTLSVPPLLKPLGDKLRLTT